MFLIFKRIPDRDRGPIEIKGRFLDYDFGYIPETHVDIIPYTHLNATIVDDEIGNDWIFIQAWNGKISVRGSSLQNDRLNVVSSTEPEGTKIKYTATEQELANGLIFFKIVMRKMLDEIYDRRFSKLQPSQLELSTWTSQREEAIAYLADNTASTPTLTALANARNITIDNMANLVYTAIQEYDAEVATLLASKQLVEGEIKNCQSISDCWIIMHNRYGMSMPLPLQQELGITEGSRLNI